MRKLIVFTDGACSMNKTWTGGWAFLIYRKGKIDITQCGYEYKSTNNRMEVYAILDVLRRLRDIERKHKVKYLVEIVSDSGYAVFPFIRYGWVDKWKKNKIGRNTINYDLWSSLIPLAIYFGDRLSFVHIRGHGKNENKFYNKYNDIVDKLCVDARLKADNL